MFRILPRCLGHPKRYANDLQSRNGNIYDPMLTGFDKLLQEYELCTTWCVSSSGSLFKYTSGESHELFDIEKTIFFNPSATVPSDITQFCCHDPACFIDVMGT